MRKVLIIFLFLVSITQVSAQQGLKSNELFEGHVIPTERMVETKIRGKALAKYELTFFRSLRFTASVKEISRIEQLVNSEAHDDAQSVSGKQSSVTMLQLPKNNETVNRYLFYKRKGKELTVIYMEGKISSIDKLRKLLNEK